MTAGRDRNRHARRRWNHTGTERDAARRVFHCRVLRLEHRQALRRVRDLEDETPAGCGGQQKILIALAGKRRCRRIESVYVVGEAGRTGKIESRRLLQK